MPEKLVTVAIPTLAADSKLADCVRALDGQTWRDFEIVIVDNSGAKLAKARLGARENLSFIENNSNVGFGAAINQVWRKSESKFLATLNDDAEAAAGWLEELLRAIESGTDIGMCASQVRMAGTEQLDSAGMLICGDGSSKQRGHLAAPGDYPTQENILAPSGSAALYRRDMLEKIDGFDEDFFLYCEDTDLGLRAQWAGWKCLYAPRAMVFHHYSHTAGRASPLKAYFVERNRLFLLVKNFPLANLILAPLISIARYWWSALAMLRGQGAAGRFREDGNSGAQTIAIVVRAHWSLLRNWNRLWRKRRAIRRSARVTEAMFQRILCEYSISAREVARL